MKRSLVEADDGAAAGTGAIPESLPPATKKAKKATATAAATKGRAAATARAKAKQAELIEALPTMELQASIWQ